MRAAKGSESDRRSAKRADRTAERGRAGARATIEIGFRRWGHWAYRHAYWLLGATGIVCALLIGQLPKLHADTSTDAFLSPDDPIRIAYDDFRRRFGRDERIVLAIESEHIFALDFLAKLRALHQELDAKVPHVHEILSLVNARSTRGEDDTLVVEDLMEDWPRDAAALARLRERVLANPLYQNLYISSDERVTTISIQLDAFADTGMGETGALAGFEDDDSLASSRQSPAAEFLSEPDSEAAVRDVREIVKAYRAPGFRIEMAGGPVIAETMNRVMIRDARRGLLWSVLAIALLLLLLLRRLVAVVLPLLVVLLSMLCTLGAMALLGSAMTLGTQILPSFLVAVGICDAVHILSVFYRRWAVSRDKEEALAFTLGHSGLAIVMTSLTTAGGLISFAAAELEPVAGLGAWAPFGVMLALLYTLVLMPALLAVIPMSPPQPRGSGRGGDRLDRALAAMGDFAAMRPWSIVAGTAVVVVVSAFGIARLHFSHDAIAWFPEQSDLRRGSDFVNDRLGGAMSIEALIDTGRENGLHDPQQLQRLEDVAHYVKGLQEGAWSVSQTISLVDILKETNQALHANRADSYRIPDDRELVAQELLLFENSGSDDLADFVDPDFRTARMTLRVPWMDAMFYPPILEKLDVGLRERLGPGIGLELTGLLPLLARTFSATVYSMAQSYVIALAIITPLMILLIGEVRRGLLSMIPNLTPVVIALGYMGWVGMPIDGSNLMVGAIVIGLAVDDTIHFMHNFRRYYEQTGDARRAIHRTLETTGRALLITSLILSAGFFTSMGAYLQNMVNFGLLAGCAILIALLANVLLASALMILVSRHDEARRACDPEIPRAARAA